MPDINVNVNDQQNVINASAGIYPTLLVNVDHEENTVSVTVEKQTPLVDVQVIATGPVGPQGIQGPPGADGVDGQDGAPGADGADGVSPVISSESITGGHRLTIVDAGGTTTVDVMDGQDGQDGTNGTNGTDGQDGVSPEVSIASITGGHSVTITDADHPTGQTFNVMDGQNGSPGTPGAAATIAVGTVTTGDPDDPATVTNAGTSSAAVFNFTIPKGDKGDTGSTGPAGPGVPSGGSTGDFLRKHSGTDYDTEWDEFPSIAKGTHTSGTSLILGKLDDQTASGNYSVAAGRGNTVTSAGSAAFGRNNDVSNSYSFSMGYNVDISGQCSFGSGYNNTVSGDYSHAEGYNCNATQQTSHAEGQGAQASGAASHAEGYYTIANHGAQHVGGKYNIPDPSANPSTTWGDYVEIIGNGTADNARSNARTLDWSGNETLAGKLTLGADPANNMDAATKQYVDGKIQPIPEAATNAPADLGTAAVGSSAKYALEDHVHNKPTYSASDVGLGNVDNVKQYSASNPPPYPVTSVNSQTGAVSLSIPSTASDVGALPDDTKYAGSPSVGGPATVSNGIHYAQVDNTSTSTKFTATIPGITNLLDGTSFWLKNGIVTSASGFTVNINNLGAKKCYNNMTAATQDTTIFNINYTMLFVYDSSLDSGAGGYYIYRGYDANTNTIGYQIRTNSFSVPMTSITYRYRLLFQSADKKRWVPANNSTSTNATAARSVCQDPINPLGPIVYYGTTASVDAGSRPSAAYLWQEYTFNLGYSFQKSPNYSLTEWKPVYLKCAPQSDGSAIIDSTTPFTQDLPSTEDGKLYILLGFAYSTTSMELVYYHPVYWYKGGRIRHYTDEAPELPAVTSADNDKFLRVVNGAWAAVTVPSANGGSF